MSATHEEVVEEEEEEEEENKTARGIFIAYFKEREHVLYCAHPQKSYLTCC